MRKVAVVTVARSDYGILRPVLNELRSRDGIDLELIVTGMHLDPRFGMTVSEIEADGMEIAHRVDTLRAGDDAADIAVAMGREIAGLSEVFAVSRPDILVIMGDRFEMLAAAVAATPFNIAIAHIHGGEASFGAIDDAMRHAITKLSHLHFASTRTYADRIVQMGEAAERVTVSGAPGLDNLASLSLPRIEDVAARFGFEYHPDDPPLVVTHHPETRSGVSPTNQITPLLEALDDFMGPVLFTMPNADAGGLEFADLIGSFSAGRPATFMVDNLGTANYFAVLGAARAMVGNSSSGIIEAASFALPVVDIGDRQKGRIHGANVIHCPPDRRSILDAVTLAVSDGFRAGLAGMTNPYGCGNASKTIADVLETVPLGEALTTKQFRDAPPPRGTG
jgi:UDP-N-acetylglucosamine 2-epimerase (non-hydrolysing)